GARGGRGQAARGEVGLAVGRRSSRLHDLLLAETPRSVDPRAEVQALVLRLLDQHHGLERLDVVDALLLALSRDLGLVRPVIELHLRDARDLAHLAEVELDLAEMLSEVDRLEEIDLPWDCHFAALS